jgi:Macrocin-O-methyltransferase (TylF)
MNLAIPSAARDKNPPSNLGQLGHHASKSFPMEGQILDDLCEAFEHSPLPLAQRLQTFPRHVRRQDLARFLVRYEIFKQTLEIHGSVVECGVFAGGGLMTWAQCSAILEPYNHTRRVIGFDTFSGFPTPHEKDTKAGHSEHLSAGAFHTSDRTVQEIERLAAIHDRNRPLGHIPKVELVQGNACDTIPRYVEQNPHTLISLLYLDFDLYEPTRAALQGLFPRVVKGGIVAFDELNSEDFPGETLALMDGVGLMSSPLRRYSADPYISYFVK